VKKHITIDFKTHLCKMDHNRHCAFEYRRAEDKVHYLAFQSHGLQKLQLPASEFDALFRQRLLTPIDVVALHMLQSSRNYDYLPADGVHELLLEIYTMAKTEGTGDINTLDLKGLTSMYNDLAVAAQLPIVKGFKDKATAKKRVEALRGEVAKPSEKQAANKEAKADASAAAFAKIAETAGTKKPAAKKATEKPVAKKAAVKTAKTEKFPSAAKKAAAKPNGSAKPARGQGIGSYCNELILKGKSNEDVLTAVRTKFPEASTSASSVAWYRNKLKSEGLLA
jgi:hypothetical protein